MHHQDGLSVYFEGLHKQRFEEYRIATRDQPKEDRATVVRRAFCEPSRTKFEVFLQLQENFELFDATGLKVTIAIDCNSSRPFSPDNVQSWWVPLADIEVAKGPGIGWEKFWTWRTEGRQGFSRTRGPFFLVPQPNGQPHNHEHREKWLTMPNAAEGSIVVYITRGTLPRKSQLGLKRCSTDPSEDQTFKHSPHPIRTEWFQKLPGDPGETYVFEGVNLARARAKAKRSSKQAESLESESIESSLSLPPNPTMQAQSKKRSPAVSADEDHQVHKKTKVDTSTVSDQALSLNEGQAKSRLSSDDGVDDDEDEEGEDEDSEDEDGEDEDDEGDDYDDDLLVRKSGNNASSDVPAHNADSPLTEHTVPLATVSHQTHTVQTPATPSTSATETGHSPPQADNQRAERMSRMRIQLQEAQMNILKIKLEHEERFGVGFEE